MCAMADSEYKKMIHSIVVPANLPSEEKGKRYQPFIDFLKVETPEKLYRFRSCKERTISELDQDIFGFAPASEMNDDFDGLLCFDKSRISDELKEVLTPKTITKYLEAAKQGIISPGIKTAIPDNGFQQTLDSSNLNPDMMNALVAQFIDFVTEEYDKRMAFLAQVTQNQKIACLSSDIESPAMWGYYANNGTGFALSYDLHKPNFSEYCLIPVIYGDERIDVTEYARWLFQQQTIQRMTMNANDDTLCSTLQRNIPCPDEFMSTKILIHKASSWSHEKEWRLIFYEKNGPSVRYPHISKRASAIYLGRNISAIYEKVLRHIAAEKDIPAYEMTIYEDDSEHKLRPQMI